MRIIIAIFILLFAVEAHAQSDAAGLLREEVAERLRGEGTTATTSISPTEQPPFDSFIAGMIAAADERKAGRLDAAAQRYRQLALGEVKHTRAPDAHRLAILCTADLLRASEPKDRSALAAAYEALLAEHLAHWPSEAAADDVRLWLAQLLVAQRDWPQAISVLQQVPPAAEKFSDSAKLLMHCYERQLHELGGDEDGQAKRSQLVAAATQHLQPIITGQENRWPDQWTELQRETAVALARLHLRYTDQPSPYAERLLQAALSGETAETDAARYGEWQTAARTLLIAAFARNGKAAEARARIGQVAAAPADFLLEVLADIDAQTSRAAFRSGNDREAGQLALAIARLLDARRAELDAALWPRLAMYRATALAAAGDRDAALAQFAALAAEAADDAEIQARYATLLAASDAPTELRQALAQWQKVESRSRRGGPRWRRARTARIELHTRLGEQAQAEKLTNLTRLLYPDWDSGTQSSQ